MNEVNQKMSNEDIKDFKKVLETIGKTCKKFNLRNVQSTRFIRDTISANLVGVSLMNKNLTGWDGFFNDGTAFENKNVTSSAKSCSTFGLRFQDTSKEKLSELTNGVICTTSFWGTSNEPDFMIVGNSNMVKDFLVSSYNEKCRNTCNVSLKRCINNGFKIVAVKYDKIDTISTITNMFPSLLNSLYQDDIYTKEDLPSIVAGMI